MKNILLFAVVMFAGVSLSQNHTNFNTSRNWSNNKKEIFFGLGASQFLGDLGGRDQVGKGYSLVDMDIPSTFAGGLIGFRYRWHPMWSTATTFYYGMLRGDDANTNEIIRNSRNLHFRSPVFELTQRIEWILLANEKVGRRYSIPGLKGFRNRNDTFYLFSGLSAIYTNPKAQVNGEWVKLRDMKTEGQGLPGGADEYSGFTLGIPFGVGFKMGFSRMWRIGIEATYMKTFSDYIDDVSTDYYDPAILAAQVSPEAAYLSNPSQQNQIWFGPGNQRGDPGENDAYLLLNIVVTKNITYPSNRVGGSISTKWKGRTKF